MRCYHFGNMYMSSIQQGIQAAHCQMELFMKYQDDTDQQNMLYDWGGNHKTMICLNAGYHERLRAIADFMEDAENPYPWSTFHESQEAMGGMLTNVAIVLPEEIYEGAKELRKTEVYPEGLTEFQANLMQLLNRCGLAR